MSTSWKCIVCGLHNNIHRYECQACFLKRPVTPVVSTEISNLLLAGYRKLTPDSQQFKMLVVEGFARKHTILIIPIDIIKLCKSFYDEVRYWQVNTDDIIQLPADTPMNHNQQEGYTLHDDIFYANNIKMHCSFDPNSSYYDKRGYTAFYLNVNIPSNVVDIVIFFELFCNENYAQFKRKISWLKNNTLTKNNQREYVYFKKNELWRKERHTLLLNCNEHSSIFFGYTVDIFSITYNSNSKKVSYFKPIVIPRKTKFRWYIDKVLIDRFKRTQGNTQFLSDTFDLKNNNWGLRIIPNGDRDLKDNIMILKLSSYKLPQKLKTFNVKCIIKNSYNKKEVIKVVKVKYWDEYAMRLTPLFSKQSLSEIDSFYVDCSVEIIGIKPQFWNEYGIV